MPESAGQRPFRAASSADAHSRASHPRRALLAAVGLAWWLGATTLVALAGCAAPGSDIHLAPLYTRLATADGGRVTEAAAGLYRQHRRDDGFLEWRTLAPLYGIERWRNGDWSAQHPFPFGTTRRIGSDLTSYLVPLYLGWRRTSELGETRSFVLTLPGLMSQRDGAEHHWGWFPFYGHFEDLLTFDSATFALWPLFVRADRAGRISYHVPWPFLGWTTGAGESSWHLFPLIARARWEGRYDRWYFLWPLFHWQRNALGGEGEEPERVLWFWPLLGSKQRGTYRAWTWLWPFFGYSRDTRSGFWALDFPFFLVRLQRGPGDTARTRFWPFYSRFESDGYRAIAWAWPLGHLRHEESAEYERDYAAFLPLWQSWDRLDKVTGETSSWRKLWPLARYEERGEWRAGALLELDPFFRNDLFSRYITGFLRLYEWEEAPVFRRERAFLGLYRRERGRGEDRRSVAGLWAHRGYEVEGRAVGETSLLFGLLRWRVTAGRGFDMLRPAFPGPGWPPPPDPATADESRTFF